MQSRQEKFGEVTEEAQGLLVKLEKKLEEQRLSAPKQIEEDANIIEDSLYLYGIDFMSTEDVNKYFERHNPQKVSWINDSSCTIKFETPEVAAKAYEVFSLSTNSEGSKIDIG